MNNLIEYKGYIGSVEFSESDSLFFGKVQGIRSLISYEGTNAIMYKRPNGKNGRHLLGSKNNPCLRSSKKIGSSVLQL
jgi:predicted HicB family RNase H-like nuclease